MTFAEFIKTKEMPKRDKLCVGEGVISLSDACIPLDNICALEIMLPPALPLVFGIIVIVAGIFLCFNSFEFVRRLGGYVLSLGIVLTILMRYFNQNRKYLFRITVNSGIQYIFENKNLEFLRDLLRKIQQAIDDRQIKLYADTVNNYIRNDITNIENYIEKMDVVDESMNISGGNNIFNSGVMKDVGGIVFGNKKETHTNVNTNIQTLSDEQWTTLIQFFESRAQNLEPNSEAYNSCVQMSQDAKRKDASALKQRIQSVGKVVFKAILGEGVSSVVKHLLELVIKA